MNAMDAYRKHGLEINYRVRIDDDAVFHASEILRVFEDDPSAQSALVLVEKACIMLRKNLESDSEERKLDCNEDCLYRSFVEVMELRKEKSLACQSDILPRAEKKLTKCKTKLEHFQKKWAPVVAELGHNSGKRVGLLRCLRGKLVSFINNTKLQGYLQVDCLSQLHSLLTTTPDLLQQNMHSAFRERLVIGPHEVAQVASSITGFPLKFLYQPFNLRLVMPRSEYLKSRLSEKLINLDDVFHKIVHALSKQKSLRGPLGSFLFLGPHGCGRTKLAKALAKEIFGDKNRVIKLDLSQYIEPDHISSLIRLLDRDKKHGSVVMFDNIENVHAWTYDVLSQIFRDGRLTDGRRKQVNFSDDLILVSSHIGHEVFGDCICLRETIPKIPFRDILKEPALLHVDFSHETCCLHQFYTKVANQFKPEFMDLFNDVVVFPRLVPQNHMAISRLQMRDVAMSMGASLKKHVILYPSDAAVQNIMCCGDILKRGAHAYENWHKVYMDPVLNDDVLKNEADDIIIIYIDALLGSRNEFSFKVEYGRHLLKDAILKRFKQNLLKLRRRYRQEKLQLNQIYRLQTSCSHLCELIRGKAHLDANRVLKESEDIVRMIEDLLKNEPSDNNELELVQLDDLNGDIQFSQGDKKKKQAKIFLKRVSRRLRRSLKRRDKATQYIIKALLRRLRAPYNHRFNESSHLPSSFLCLGLTPESKRQFAKSLTEHLVMDDGKKLLFQVDLSRCTEPDSFFRCTYTMDTHLLLTKAVERGPNCVIIFHHLEMAHISVFSTILSILDDGVSEDNEGNITNFSNSVVVIVSNLGNKEMIAGLNGHQIKCPINPVELESTSHGEAAVGSPLTDHEMGLRGLRFELLYRLDQLLLFDPFSDDQLNRFAKSPLKSLEETSHSLNLAFRYLFHVQGKEVLLLLMLLLLLLVTFSKH
ncbi:hypothetical protein ACS0TY_024290 [Phlomoides rotata]